MSLRRIAVPVWLLAVGCICGESFAQRTTWLMIDKQFTIPKLVCNKDNCDHDGMGKLDITGFLAGVPLHMLTPVDYVHNGYWHVVINPISAGSTANCGRSGSVRIHVNPDNGRRAYYNETVYAPSTVQMGKATMMTCRFDCYTRHSYDGRILDADWQNPLGKWMLGPAPTAFFQCTPITMRIRVFITLDPKFVPPSKLTDPVGVQPGGSTMVPRQLTAPYSSIVGTSRATLLFPGAPLGAGVSDQVFSIRGRRLAREAALHGPGLLIRVPE